MFKHSRFLGLLIISQFFTQSLLAQVPAYYTSINFDTSAADLKLQLTNLITNTHTTLIPYTSSSTDTWDVLRLSDLESENSTNVLLIYGYDDNDGTPISDRTRDAFDSCHSSSCTGLWTREHVFAKSLANPSLSTNDPGPGTDVHNLRAADSQKNTQRSNRLFLDDSGDSRVVGEYFYPGDEWKGDVARIIMYMYLRYPTQCEAINIGTGSITYASGSDMPDLFLEWNQEDPVSNLELTRNDVIFSYQGNRNPFIDNPYLATLIWGGPQAEETWGVLSASGIQTIRNNLSVSTTQNFIEINGLESSEFNITLYNLLGQELFQANYSKIDISHFKQGVYLVKIDQFGQVTTVKFIVY